MYWHVVGFFCFLHLSCLSVYKCLSGDVLTFGLFHGQTSVHSRLHGHIMQQHHLTWTSSMISNVVCLTSSVTRFRGISPIKKSFQIDLWHNGLHHTQVTGRWGGVKMRTKTNTVRKGEERGGKERKRKEEKGEDAGLMEKFGWPFLVAMWLIKQRILGLVVGV